MPRETLAEEGLSFMVRLTRGSISLFKELNALIKANAYKAVGEVTPEKFFNTNKNVRIDEFAKTDMDKQSLEVFKNCMKSAKVQYTVQDMGNDSYTIYFRADDVSKVHFALNEFSKQMDEIERNKEKSAEKVNQNPKEKSADADEKDIVWEEKDNIKDDIGMDLDSVLDAAQYEADAHNEDIEHSKDLQRDMSL